MKAPLPPPPHDNPAYRALATWKATGAAVNALPAWDNCLIRVTGRRFR